MTATMLNMEEANSILEDEEAEMSVVISDPRLPDNPLIFVTPEFTTQTGYEFDEVVGRNCRFLQGEETNEDAIEVIRHGLAAQTRFTVDLVNYRKDGTPFLNRLRIRPIFDDDGDVMYFAGAQNPL